MPMVVYVFEAISDISDSDAVRLVCVVSVVGNIERVHHLFGSTRSIPASYSRRDYVTGDYCGIPPWITLPRA